MAAEAQTQIAASNVVQLRPVAAPISDGNLCTTVAGQLLLDHPATYAAWFAQLVQVDLRDGVLVLGAKSGFVVEYVQHHLDNLLTAAAAHHDPSVRLVKVTAILE